MITNAQEQNDADFSSISLESLGCHLIFGEINESSMKDAVTFLLKANLLFQKKELTFYINSTGGSCRDGFALIDLMSVSRLSISTVSSGAICSMGVLIACAGQKGKRVMTRNTEIMVHQFASESSGKFHELMAQQTAHQYLAHQFVEHFKRHSTMPEKLIKKILFGPSDVWLTPAECKKYGLIDTIIDELPTAATGDEQLSRQLSEQKPKTAKRKKR
jgi:ATP-dependent Clp protease protease subunit